MKNLIRIVMVAAVLTLGGLGLMAASGTAVDADGCGCGCVQCIGCDICPDC
jgi:hypothetical protein